MPSKSLPLALSVALFATLSIVPAQEATDTAAAPGTLVRLTPQIPQGGRMLRWSPKGSKVALTPEQGTLVGRFVLGLPGLPAIEVRLARKPGGSRYERLDIDLDRDGTFGELEQLTCTANERRGKWWSSFEAVPMLPWPEVPASAPTKTRVPQPYRPYPIALWFVEDPAEPDAAPVLRWSRRGWHQGRVELDGAPAYVLVAEMQMDGVFDANDAWFLARSEKELLASRSRSLGRHAWLDGKAYRAEAIEANGAALRLVPFDPGMTQEEEERLEDVFAADRAAPAATAPLAFGKDFAAALAEAEKTGKRVFLDFETTWCGPCKQMDQLVYTRAAVVAAARDVIAVKLDGDAEKELVQRFAVKGYPTLILLDAKGKELRRASGYQGVAAMCRFFAAGTSSDDR